MNTSLQLDPGQIIILNGPSSVGKTSTAKALRLRLDRPFLHLGIDTWILDVWPQEIRGSDGPKYIGVTQKQLSEAEPDNVVLEISPDGLKIMEGLHVAVRALSNQGYDVIMDFCFWEREFLEACVNRLHELSVWFIRLHCPLDIILERFDTRPDRSETGLAQFWFHRTAEVDQLINYDLELDTSMLTPDECADRIVEHLNSGPSPSAFEQLTEMYGL